MPPLRAAAAPRVVAAGELYPAAGVSQASGKGMDDMIGRRGRRRRIRHAAWLPLLLALAACAGIDSEFTQAFVDANRRLDDDAWAAAYSPEMANMLFGARGTPRRAFPTDDALLQSYDTRFDPPR